MSSLVNKANRLNSKGLHTKAANLVLKNLEKVKIKGPLLRAGILALSKLQRQDEAIEAVKRAIAANPKEADIHFLLGLTLLSKGELQLAIDAWQTELAQNPTHREAAINLAIALRDTDRHDKAYETCIRALEHHPDDPFLLRYGGQAAANTKRLDEAAHCFRALSEITPEDGETWYLRGLTERDLGNFQEAENCHRKALEFLPDFADGHFELAYALLCQHRYDEGFEEYTWRLSRPNFKINTLGLPRWTGEEIGDARLLIIAEQGVGDVLNFSRLFFDLKSKGFKMALWCHDTLADLMDAQNLFDEVTPFSKKPNLDCAVEAPLLCVPYVVGDFKRFATPNHPSLTVPRHSLTLPTSNGGLKVGICWAGNPNYQGDYFRSTTLEKMLTIFDGVSGVDVFSLQVGQFEKAARETDFPLTNLAPGITSYMDTASLIDQLDLVITVDTSVAHLAGCLGKPTWIALANIPDWRWCNSGGECLWYKSARLFYQDRQGDWDSVFSKIRQALIEHRP